MKNIESMNSNSQFLLPINFLKNAGFLFQRVVILYMISGCVKFFNPWVSRAGFFAAKEIFRPTKQEKNATCAPCYFSITIQILHFVGITFKYLKTHGSWNPLLKNRRFHGTYWTNTNAAIDDSRSINKNKDWTLVYEREQFGSIFI